VDGRIQATVGESSSPGEKGDPNGNRIPREVTMCGRYPAFRGRATTPALSIPGVSNLWMDHEHL